MGIIENRTGSVRFEGAQLIGRHLGCHRACRHRLLPGRARHILHARRQGESAAAPASAARRTSISTGYSSLFPTCRNASSSQGTKLSGGEQQMLAIGRILRTGARLLLLDEPTEGLAPVIIQQIGRTIGVLKAQGFTILLVEQNFHFAATLADRYYVMEHGRIVDSFRPLNWRPIRKNCTTISEFDNQGHRPLRAVRAGQQPGRFHDFQRDWSSRCRICVRDFRPRRRRKMTSSRSAS